TDQFERIALANPDLLAVVHGAETRSYRQLNAHAEQVADLLRSRGIGRGHFVGLGLQRCVDLPAALLGILKAGAAYVPIDPNYPAARIEQIISSAKLEYVVTSRALCDEFPGIETLCMDDQATLESRRDLAGETPPKDDLLHAILTTDDAENSKSAVTHPGFDSLLHWYSIELQLGPSDRTLAISAPSFDLTRKNFFNPLANGGTLILEDSATYHFSRIAALIRHHHITLIHCTPSAFYPLVDAAAEDAFSALSSLRFAVLSGGPISINRLRAWLGHPDCRAEVVNSYGPTECTDTCTFHRLHRGNLNSQAITPLGRETTRAAVPIHAAADLPLHDGETEARHSNLTSFTTPDPIASNILEFREGDARRIPGDDSLELQILALWSEVLNRPVSGPTTHFFELGGNSSHIAVIHVRLMEMIGRKFPITALFALPSARALAEFLSPQNLATSTVSHHDRARLAHTGFSRFRARVLG
ncbi:MAG: AMP-binding protein, partial [Luteolibacter sp.]